jgi:hypothetical protein
MFLDALHRNLPALAKIEPDISKALLAVDPGEENLTRGQAMVLSSMVIERSPNLIVDLGTGGGASACTLAAAAGLVSLGSVVHTFDMIERWPSVETRLKGIDRSKWAPIETHVVDIERFDFDTLTSNAESVLVFWDAHGHGVASGVLGQLMPSIADKPHLAVCHDMTDIRLAKSRTYDRKQPWRGMDDWYAQNGARACVNIGWTLTVVDQVIPIIDFCSRNQIEFRSVDEDILINGDQGVLAEITRDLQLPNRDFAMGYFTMNETLSRYFPAPAVLGPRINEIVTVPLTRILARGEGNITARRPDAVTLVTDPRQWAYSAEVEFDLFGAEETRIVTICVEVESGILGIGLLRDDGSGWVARSSVTEGPTEKEVNLVIPTHRLGHKLVFDNWTEGGKPARGVIRSIKIAPQRDEGGTCSTISR